MENNQKIVTNADAIRILSNDELEDLLCNYKCNECDIKHLCGDKYPNGFSDWLNAKYSESIFKEFYIKGLLYSMNLGYYDDFKPFPSKLELWLRRVIYTYEHIIEQSRKFKEEHKARKMMREDKELIIEDLSYNTLEKVFDNDILYDTNKIIIKQRKFTNKDVIQSLTEHSKYLESIYSSDKRNDNIGDRGKVIDLLNNMFAYDLQDTKEMATAIQETLLFRQMQLYGLRKFVYGDKSKVKKRYFNPEAPIVVEILE